MRRIRSIGLYALIAAATLVAASGSASANCTAAQIAGKWHFYAMQGQSPNIKQTAVTVKNGSNQNVTVKVFPNTGMPFENATATAVKCDLTLSANGTLTSAPCVAYGVQPGDGGAVSITGKINFGAGSGAANSGICAITGGTLHVPGDPAAVTVLGGYVRANQGSGIARQGAYQVYLFNIIKH